MPGYTEVGPPVWYDPSSGIFSVGEYSEIEPKWDNWYWNTKEYARVNKAVKSASAAGQNVDLEGAALAGINPNLYGFAQELIEAVDKARALNVKDYTKFLKSGAILKREDFTALKTIMPQTKIIASKPRKHILKDIIRIDNAGEFLTKIYTFDGPYDVVQENLAELNVPDITGFPSFTPQTIPMERYGIHYAFSEEFIAEQFDFNIKQFVIDNVAGQMDIVQNKKIADVLNTSSTFTAYGDWAAKTGNISTRNPGDDINAEAEKIFQTERNEGLTLVTNRVAYNTFITNSWVSGYGTPTYKQNTYSFGNAIYNNIPMFTGLDWAVDTFITGTKFIAFDPAAIYAAQMPQRIVDYKNTYQTFQGTIIRSNFIVKPIDTTRLLGGSGITV